MSTVVDVWPGSGSNPSGSTPFGYFDDDADFQSDAPKIASWCAKRLGYPTHDVEMVDHQFYACFEEAIMEYSSQVNEFMALNNITELQGFALSGSDFTHKNVQLSPVNFVVKLAEDYASEVNANGKLEWRRGWFEVTESIQQYDLKALWSEVSHSGAEIEIKRVFHDASPSILKSYNNFSIANNVMNPEQFGLSQYAGNMQYLMMPVYEDLLRAQAIEFNDIIRRSAYSFEINNNKIRVFPIPSLNFRIYFDYVLTEDRYSGSFSSGVVSDVSNIPYGWMQYADINTIAKNWIRKYTLATAKEMLGIIRSKFPNIPIPNADITLDGDSLKQSAEQDKQQLVQELREMLDKTAKANLLENKQREAESLQSMLGKIPLYFYVG